jgi:adenylyltransferase/sulfurtransferase
MDATLTAPWAALSSEELKRYSRHLLLREVGAEGQRRLRASRVAVVGLGGLGSPLALYLAAAGVGTLRLIEDDRVDVSNLQRQVLFASADVARPKLEAAAERLRGLNPLVRLELEPRRLTAATAEATFAGADVVCDGSDNFPTRYVVNDACVRLGLPSVYASILRFEGQVSVFWGARGPCYRCLFPEAPPEGVVPSCGEAGVLGVLPGVVGALQANEALKLLLGVGEPLLGRLLVFDALRTRFRELALRKNPACPVCSLPAERVEVRDLASACTTEPRRGLEARVAGGAATNGPSPDPEVLDLEPAEVSAWRASGRPLMLLDVRSPEEHEYVHLPGTTLIPLPELEARLRELDPRSDIVVYCHYGPRSTYAVLFLRAQGFKRVWNLAGGIDAWSLEVDPGVARY